MQANQRQVGGSHYGGGEYQHWDYAHDAKLHGLTWTATKYVGRARKKNGKEDLEKALHYIDKAEELRIVGSTATYRVGAFWRYVTSNDLTMLEAQATWYMQEGEWEQARAAVNALIQSVGE